MFGTRLDTFPWRQPNFAKHIRSFVVEHPASLIQTTRVFRQRRFARPSNLVDGPVLESGRHRGIALPQVRGFAPNARDFLDLPKPKAGLPADFWSDEIHLYPFRVAKCSKPEIRPIVH